MSIYRVLQSCTKPSASPASASLEFLISVGLVRYQMPQSEKVSHRILSLPPIKQIQPAIY